jgi:GNAT superfamily N-acetyltransferase
MLKPDNERQKREWFDNVIAEYGNCIRIAYLDNAPIGFIQYAPAKFFPRAIEYSSGPVSKDSVFLACLYIINKENRRKGLGTIMLRNLLAELKQKEVKVVETFARKGSFENPSGPLEIYSKHNFRIRREKDDFPLVRFEI